MRYWIVKMARDDSDPSAWLRKGTHSTDGSNHPLVKQRPSKGDRCFYWQTGGTRQLFGLGTIKKTGSSSRKRFVASHRADTGMFGEPLTIDELRTAPELREASFLKPGYAATFYALDGAQASLLYQLCVANATLYGGAWPELATSSKRANAAWRVIQKHRGTVDKTLTPFPRTKDKKQLQARLTRAGQVRFRRMLRDATGGRCEISGCEVLQALDACHIKSHSGGGTYKPANGVLLRTDIHALIDAGLMHIAPRSLKISCAPTLAGSSYWEYQGQHLLPRLDKSRPDGKALATYWGAEA